MSNSMPQNEAMHIAMKFCSYRERSKKEVEDKLKSKNFNLDTIKNCINEYIDKHNNEINIYNFPWNINDISSVVLIGCGTAYHSCLVAKYWFEQNTNMDISVDIASEFRYRKIKFKQNALYVFVSQSGETADTFAALDLCKKNEVKTCAIVNVV